MTLQDSRYQHLIHSRQFLCGPRAVQAISLGGRESFRGLEIDFHLDLVATKRQFDGCEILCLGHILDPHAPQLTNAEILVRLVQGASSFEAVEEATSRLGGRWLLFVGIGDECRLYPDAAGTKSAFYTVRPDGVWIASQPGLLVTALPIRDNNDMRTSFGVGLHNATSWPCAATPFDGVRQLLPNQFLDLCTGQVRRLWPRAPIPRLDLDTAATVVAELLRGSIAAVLARGSVAMPLTGGFDSRTLFACAGDMRERIRFFTVAGYNSAHYDRSVPRQLGRKFGVDVGVVRPKPYPEGFWELLQGNTARMWWDPADYMVYTFCAANTQFILFGLLAEIARCFYYPDGRHPTNLTPRMLADVARFGEHPIAEAAFAEWLSSVPADSDVATLDLFYWEHRAGNWVAMTCTTYDAVADIIAPYNCRLLLEAALGVDTVHRASPHAFHQRVCAISEPGTLSIPFNFSRVDQLQALAARFVPWRLRNAANRLRMRMAGF